MTRSPEILHGCRVTSPAGRLSAGASPATGRDDTIVEVTGDGTLVFPYWSFTKTVLAACALRLAEAGAVTLDRPLPGRPFTLRQLLGHTAGLPDYTTLPAYHAAVARDETPWPRAALIAATLAQGMRFAPGRGWAYSNLGSLLARAHLEEVTGQPLARMIDDLVTGPLGLPGIRLAETRADFDAVHWSEARRYHPGWVYHGCLTGTAPEAARLLHGIFSGPLLHADSLAEMMQTHPLGGALPGRPWTEHGYGLGLMSGRFGAAGRAMGHSGAGPFSSNAVYHFPDLATPVTLASFAHGPDEGRPEAACARMVRDASSPPA